MKETNKITQILSITILIFVVVFGQEIESKCQNMLQKNGQCTKCPSTKFLYRGECYTKIKGCSEYISDKICLSCQSGYVYNQGGCIKQAIFYRLQRTDIPPVKINIDGELTLKDIQQRIGQSRKLMFDMINRYFKQKYVQNISSCTISNVKYIETINGVIFTIYYRSLMRIYQAVAFIDSKRDSNRKKSITQLQFLQRNSIPAYSLEEIHSGLRKKYQQVLKQCLLSSIQKIEENRYRISFVNSKGIKYESTIVKEPFSQEEQLKKVQNPIDMEDVLAYIFSLYSDLKSQDFQVTSAPYFQTNSNEGTYILIFSQKIEIKIKNQKGVFDLLSYKDLLMNKKQQQQNDNKTSQDSHKPISKEFSSFQDFTDPVFLEVWRSFISQYPKYEQYEINSVESEKTSGTNFLVKIKSPRNIVPEVNVQTLIQYSLHAPIQVTRLKIDGKIVDLDVKNYKEEVDKQKVLQKIKSSNSDASKSFDYQKDQDFTDAYVYFTRNSKVVNPIAIFQVNKFECDDHIDYQIIYSSKQKAKVRKFKQKNNNLRSNNGNKPNFDLIYYLIDGVDVVTGKSLVENNKDKIIQFIKSQKPQIFKNSLFETYKDGYNSYQVKLLTPTGSYQVKIDQGKNNYAMSSLINTSPQNCYQFIQEQVQSETQLAKVDQFLKSSYGLNGAIFQLVQAQVTQKSKRYRVLYTDSLSRKLDIIVQSFSGKYIVIQSLVLQEGYMQLPFADTRITPVQALAKVHFGEFTSDCQIKLRLFNQTHYKLIYSCPRKSYEYIYQQKPKTDKLQLIYKEDQTQKQTQINENNLVDLKQIVKDSKFVQIDTLARNKFSQYIQISQATQVERNILAGVQGKVYTFYKIYYKSTLGHYVCESTWSQGQIKLTNFYLVAAETNKNCQVYDEQTKQCVQCLSGFALEFRTCYKKIQFCSVQTGNICVKCETKAILSSGKCLRNCMSVFKIRSDTPKSSIQ